MSCEHCGCCDQACDCACIDACAAPAPLGAPANRAGRGALEVRIGEYGRFFADAKQRLSSSDAPALRALGTRDPGDPAIALLDAWSVAADVLTFYRERLTNEGYLRTATLPRSLRELARQAGYRPRPGVSASVWLAYLLDDSAAPVVIPAGAKVQTVPNPGEQMQTFETSAALAAQAPWSTMPPRQTRIPAIRRADALTRPDLRLADTTLVVRPGERVLFRFGDGPGQQVVREVASARTDVQNGWVALALKPRPGLTSDLATALLDILDQAIAADTTMARDDQQSREVADALGSYLLGGSALDTMVMLEQAGRGPVVEHALAVMARIQAFQPPPAPTVAPVSIDAVLGRLATAGAAQLASSRLQRRTVDGGLAGEGAVRGALLQALVPQLGARLYKAWNVLPGADSNSDIAPAVYLLRTLAAPFGAAAPYRRNVIITAVASDLTDWPLQPIDANFAFLETVNDAVVANSYAVVETPVIDPDNPDEQAYLHRFARVRSARAVGRGDYGIAAKVTRLELADAQTGEAMPVVTMESVDLTYLRNTVYAVQSEPVALAAEPIPDDIAGSTIMLERLYDGLETGRWIIVAGERTDIVAGGAPVAGVFDGELAMIAAVAQETDPNAPGDTRRTTLTLETALAYSYRRATATIYGNVVKATHGETVSEVLGSGDAQARFASFALKRAPLTFVPAPTTAGVAGTQTVRVNELRWNEADSLLDASGSDRSYQLDTDEQGAASVTFGDGVHGARLPSGQENVRAVYRVGIGQAGNVQAGQISLLASRPLGVRAVLNPLAASGGADRDGPERIRANVPLAVQALSPNSRLVSVLDYAVFARRFAGIGHAQAAGLAAAGASWVHVTLAGVDDIPLAADGDLLANLREAYRSYGDPALPVMLGVRELIALFIQAKVALQADADWDAVEPALRARLQDTFSFQRRDLGQPAYLSEAVAAMQGVPGVDWVDVDVFGGVSELALRSTATLKAAVDGLQRQIDAGAADTVVPCLPAMPATDATEQRRALIEQRDGRLPLFLPAQLAFLVPGVPQTLVLNLVNPGAKAC